MRHSFPFILLLTVSLLGCTATRNSDARALQGAWTPTSAELAGKPMPGEVLKTISLKLDNGKYQALVGNVADRGTYTFDPTITPKAMTITGTDGPNNGKTYPAIYELHADTLRICYDLSGQQRPTDFKTTPGTQLYLVTYTRKQ